MSDKDNKDNKDGPSGAEDQKIFKEHEPAGPDFSQASAHNNTPHRGSDADGVHDDFEDFDEYQDTSGLSGHDDFEDFDDWDDTAQTKGSVNEETGSEEQNSYQADAQSFDDGITGNIDDDFAEDPLAEDDFQKIVAEEQAAGFKRKKKTKFPVAAVLAGALVLAGAGGFYVYTQNEATLPIPLQDDGPSLRQTVGRVAQSLQNMPDAELPGQGVAENLQGSEQAQMQPPQQSAPFGSDAQRPIEDNPFSEIPQPEAPTLAADRDAPLLPLQEEKVEAAQAVRPQVEIIDYEEMMRQRNGSTKQQEIKAQAAVSNETQQSQKLQSPDLNKPVEPETKVSQKTASTAREESERSQPAKDVKSSASKVREQRSELQRTTQSQQAAAEARAEMERQRAIVAALNEKAAKLARKGGLAPESVARPIDSSASFFALSENRAGRPAQGANQSGGNVEDFVRVQPSSEVSSGVQPKVIAGDMPESARRALSMQGSSAQNASSSVNRYVSPVVSGERLAVIAQPPSTSSAPAPAVTTRMDQRPSRNHVEKVLQHFGASSPAQALRDVSSALEGQPNNAMYYYSKALLLEEVGEAAQAVNAYEQALDLDVIYGTNGQLPRAYIFDRLGVLRRTAGQ